MSKTRINIEIDASLKAQAEALAKSLGINVTGLIRYLLIQKIKTEGENRNDNREEIVSAAG